MTETGTTRYAGTAFATALGGYALFGGLISFLGWPLDIPRLTDWFNDEVSIQPNACVLMVLSGEMVLIALTGWGQEQYKRRAEDSLYSLHAVVSHMRRTGRGEGRVELSHKRGESHRIAS